MASINKRDESDLRQVVLEKNANRDQLRTWNPVQITDHVFQQFENFLLHFSVLFWYCSNKQGQCVLWFQDEVVCIVRTVDVIDAIQYI